MTAAAPAAWWRCNAATGTVTLTLHVQPNARKTAVGGRHGDALKLRIAAPAVENKANLAIIDFLHQWFKLPASQIAIRQGSRGRHKVVEIARCDAGILKLLASLEASCPAN